MNQGMKPKFLFLADLHVYILSFLPYQDILRCTSVCRDLCQTYLSSSELQYIVELSGQQLLPVDLPLDSHTPTISEYLQLLRDKAHAWFKLNTQPVEHVDVSNKYIMKLTFMSNGHFCLMDDPTLQHHDYLRGPTISKIFPILQEPSQRVFDCVWHSDTLSSVPNAQLNDILMDLTQNLLAAAYHILDGPDVHIDILPLDGGGAHPQAAGTMLFMLPELRGPVISRIPDLHPTIFPRLIRTFGHPIHVSSPLSIRIPAPLHIHIHIHIHLPPYLNPRVSSGCPVRSGPIRSDIR
ncbi:uncharacterized protein HD556DRAFT_1437795 [Suillus plorans]|uniref:F-box domain-containing protein n=1 Tax=Suillus plorans TaxID=116603 RepID=A0A9P7J4Y3_9AGAM|nr:uncharacterized protein HD556DRAFT_1437795 [Suillus plorans]KAG1802731.1 hypothetical protein HD556DRAFT_1437795 [Suillus plorans]